MRDGGWYTVGRWSGKSRGSFSDARFEQAAGSGGAAVEQRAVHASGSRSVQVAGGFHDVPGGGGAVLRGFPRETKGAIARALFDPEARMKLSCCGVVADGGLGLGDEGGESSSVVHGNVGEHLAVELDTGGLEAVDELRVADAVDLGGGVDAHDPEGTVLPLLLLAAAVGELESTLDGFLRCLVEL